MSILIKSARAAFLNVFKATAFAGTGNYSYSGTFIFPPDSPNVKVIEDEMLRVATEKWGERAPAIIAKLRSKNMLALHDVSGKVGMDDIAGNVYLTARNTVRPTVVRKDNSLLTEADGVIYPGCYVHAIVDIWAQDNQFGQRINASLLSVRFSRDGPAFGGSPPALTANAVDFDGLTDQDDEELLT